MVLCKTRRGGGRARTGTAAALVLFLVGVGVLPQPVAQVLALGQERLQPDHVLLLVLLLRGALLRGGFHRVLKGLDGLALRCVRRAGQEYHGCAGAVVTAVMSCYTVM